MSHPEHLLEVIFAWVLQASWQAAVLAGLILLAQWALRKRLSPAWRYGFWLLLVTRLLMPVTPRCVLSVFNLSLNAPVTAWDIPALQALTGLAFPPGQNDLRVPGTASRERIDDASASPRIGAQVADAKPNKKLDWFHAALFGWVAGVVFLGGRLVWTNTRFRSRIIGHQTVGNADALRRFDNCRASLKIARSVRLIETEEVESPAVYGLWRRWLLLPDGVFERFSMKELECIFFHEMAHIKRGDLAVNWLVAILQVLHWFNPVLWLAWARMRADRELATDSLALAHVDSAEKIAYGETILKLADGFSRQAIQPGLVGIAESKAGLKERLRAISEFGTVRRWRWVSVPVAVVIAGVGLTDAEQTRHLEATGKKDTAAGITGTILDPSGRPVSGAEVALNKPGWAASLGIGTAHLDFARLPRLAGQPPIDGQSWSKCTTDAQGRFHLDEAASAFFLVAANEKGFAQIPTNRLSPNMTITLEPWGRIKGTLRRGDTVDSLGKVSIGYTFSTFSNFARKLNPLDPMTESFWYPDTPNSTSGTAVSTVTDDNGRYAFDFVRPGEYEVYANGVRKRVTINANKTTIADIGGKGRPVIGQFKIRNPKVKINWEDAWQSTFGFCYFATEPAKPAEPFKSREEHMAWRRTLEADRGLDNSERGYDVMIDKDGSFSIERVEPGTYALELYLFDPGNRVQNSRDLPAYLGTNVIAQYDGYDRTFVVPAEKTDSSKPLDLGVIEISVKE